MRAPGPPRRGGPLLGALRLSARPESVGLGRRWTVSRLGASGAVGRVDEVELLASELLTNAVTAVNGMTRRRTRRTRRLRLLLWREDAAVRVEVYDHHPALPVMCPAGVDDESGRGLALVAALAKEWGARPVPGGKVVWFALDEVWGEPAATAQ